MRSNVPTTRRVRALSTAFWKRECARYDVDPYDARLVAGIALPRASHEASVAALPLGSPGFSALTEIYLASLSRSDRSASGRFYTPRDLGHKLATKALSDPGLPEGIIVDPACGGGALLVAAVERLAALYKPHDLVRLVVERVRGTDLDTEAVRLCELAVRVALLPYWAALNDSERPAIPRLADVRDGLDDDRAAAVVLSNPPFGRVRLDAGARSRFADVLYGHAHLPTLFLHASVERLAPNGTAAFVLPASIVGGAYYQKLRTYLTHAAPPQWLAFVDQREGVFAGGVLQETLLGTFVRGRLVGDVEVERIPPDGHPQVFSARAWRRTHSWLVPRAATEVELVERAMKRSKRLIDYGWKVSTGPLVWNRHKEQLSDSFAIGRVPVVWASDIKDGSVTVGERRENRFVWVEGGQDWLVLDEPAVLIQRTTAPEQPRRLVAGLLDSETLARAGGRVVVENHVNVCTWSGEGPLTPERLIEYLASDEADRLYRCTTGSVAVSAFELRQLPLPDASELSSPKERTQAA